MANKTQRNDPCPCGSGRKYKHCCLQKDQAAQSTALAASAAMAAAEQREIDAMLERDDQLAAASNAVIDLIKAGELDQAEKAAWNLLGEFPEVHDGFDRLGMVYRRAARTDRPRTSIAGSSNSCAPIRSNTIRTSRSRFAT